MKRLEAIFLIFKEISEQFCGEYSAVDRLLIAEKMVFYADTYYDGDTQVKQKYSRPNYYTKNLVDAFKRPFEILEQESKNMRLYENNDW